MSTASALPLLLSVGCVAVVPEEEAGPDPIPATLATTTTTTSTTSTTSTPAPATTAPASVPIPEQPNVLLVVLDDWGVDMVARTGSTTAPPTPTIDGLADQGVSFARAYAQPNCSPARASLMTGMPPHATGVGDVLGCPNQGGLPDELETVADRLQAAGYATAAYGKWHLGSIDGGLDPVEAADPLLRGFDAYGGAVQGATGCTTDGLPATHDDWERCEDGACDRPGEYDAISQFRDAEEAVRTLPAPWFVYLPLYAPHAPYVAPPGAPRSPIGDTAAQRHYREMVTDADARLGELLASVDLSQTVVIVVGDNGSPGDVVMAPRNPERAKGTVYDGGVHVPLVVAGPGVARGARTDALADLTDLFATLSELADVPLPADHPAAGSSASLLPVLADPTASVRSSSYVEGFEGRGSPARRPEYLQQAVTTDDGWKLVRIDACAGDHDPARHQNWLCTEPVTYPGPTLELYRSVTPEEVPDDDAGAELLADGVDADEQAALDRLLALLDAQYDPTAHR